MTPPILPLALLPALLGPPVSGSAVPAAAPGLFFREDWKETPPQTPVTQEHVAHPDLIRALRIVLELGYFEGLSSTEIAARIEVPVGTVKSRVAAALAKLRLGLTPESGT